MALALENAYSVSLQNIQQSKEILCYTRKQTGPRMKRTFHHPKDEYTG